MTTPLIRDIIPGDLPQLLKLCERAMEFDRIPEPTLAQKTTCSGDEGLGVVAEIDGRVVGFLQGGLGRGSLAQTGFIRILAVGHAHRNQGIGSRLLKEVESRLQARGATTFSTGDCPHNYLQPGVDFRSTGTHCFFWKHGYEFFRENHNLVAPLPPPGARELDMEVERLASHGIRISLATTDDFPACEKFLRSNWEPWITEARYALHQEEGGLWLAWSTGEDLTEEVVGFSAYGGNNIGMPWFGPMGTRPGMRGRGVGSVLLRLCLRGLADLGYHQAIIPWVGPIRFYARACHATVDRSFWVHRKVIADSIPKGT